MSEPSPPLVRLQATYRGRLGVEVGIFVAVDHLRRADRLTEGEEELYLEIDDWFRAELPNPPFYADGNTVGAVTWFRRSASEEMLKRLEPLCGLLDKYGVPWVAAEASDPGTVIYQDQFQVGAIPHQRFEPTPMPSGVVLGPTTAGSKRHLAKSVRRSQEPTAGRDISASERARRPSGCAQSVRPDSARSSTPIRACRWWW